MTRKTDNTKIKDIVKRIFVSNNNNWLSRRMHNYHLTHFASETAYHNTTKEIGKR